MDGHKGYYSLIQYAPNPSRAEAVNVGVLLFCPTLNVLDAEFSRSNDRVRRFFGRDTELDLVRLNTRKQAIKDRFVVEKDKFKTLSDLEKFIHSRANEILITDPRSIRVHDPKRQLTELFDELVGGRSHPGHEVFNDFSDLQRIFRQPRLNNLIQFDIAVQLPVINREIRFPYAYRNGILNLVKPQKLSTGRQGTEKAMVLAYEGELIKNDERQLVVVLFSEKSDVGRKTELEAVKVLQHKKVKTVTRKDLPEFEQEIISQAH